MAVAQVDDVALSLGRPLTSEEEDQIAQWLGDAEMQIRLRLGDVSLLDQEALAFVEREAVILKLRNPQGYQSESIDDYTYRWGDASGRIAILDDWWDLLIVPGVTTSSAFTITPFGEPGYTEPDSWISTTEHL